MSMPVRRSLDVAPGVDWDAHYSGAGGMPGWQKVELRKAVTQLLEPGEIPLEVDPFTAEIVYNKLRKEGPKVNIGSGIGFGYENELRRLGDQADHYSLEPNPEGALTPYYELPDFRKDVAELKATGYKQGLEELYRNTGRVMMNGALKPYPTLIRSDANHLPFPNNTIDAVTWILSGYCIHPEMQQDAFIETERVLSPQGIYLGVFSHKESKAGIRNEEQDIAEDLSRRLGVECIKPTPISAWLTTHKAIMLAKQVFDWVALYEHKAKMVFDTPEKVQALYRAHATTRDLYRIPDNFVDGKQLYRMPTKREFQVSLMATVGKKVRDADIQADGEGGMITDTLMQGFIVAAKKAPEHVPVGFREV